MEKDTSPCQCCMKKCPQAKWEDCTAHLRMIDECFSLQVPIERCWDGTRPIICKECIRKLKQCYKFMVMIQTSQFSLQMPDWSVCTPATVNEADQTPETTQEYDDDHIWFHNYAIPTDGDGNRTKGPRRRSRKFRLHLEGPQTLDSVQSYAPDTYKRCDVCEKVVQVASFKRHMSHHARKPPVNCQVASCRARYNSTYSRLRHMRIVHGVQSEVHRRRRHLLKNTAVCDACGHLCLNPATLAAHVLVHSTTEYVSCLLCKTSFANVKDLGRHQRLHFRYKAMICAHCGEGFAGRISLRMHLSSEHGMTFCLK